MGQHRTGHFGCAVKKRMIAGFSAGSFSRVIWRSRIAFGLAPRQGCNGLLGTYLPFLDWLARYEFTRIDGCVVMIRFMVWAYPYNWTASKRASAAGLRAVVTEAGAVASKEAKRLNRLSRKPILVTHSMGGLVACGYTQLLGKAADVHSVIHGAMPTHGSPELYKRIRGGFEGATRHVLGSDQLRSLPRRRTCPVRWNWHRTESTRISRDASLGCGHLTA